VAVWGGVVFTIFRRSARQDWPWLAALLFGCMVLGILILVAPEGVDGNGDYLGRFFISVGISAALGLAIGLARKRARLHSIAAAIAGDVFLPGLMILVLIWFVVGGGHCFD
jgi:H+/Cl- antiporter ClcA